MSTVIDKSLVSQACPTYFKCWCREATKSGSGGYVWVGRQIASKLHDLAPHTAISDEEWDAEVANLAALADQEDDAGILGWFDEHLPRCMRMIPQPRREAFLRGFYLAINEDEVDIESY